MRRFNSATGGSTRFLIINVAIVCSLHLDVRLATAAKQNADCQNNPSSCGNIRNISYPFRLNLRDDDPRSNCGDPRFELTCESNRTILYLNDDHGAHYYVNAIWYKNWTIRLVDPGLQDGNCSSMPLFYFTSRWRNAHGLYYLRSYKYVVFVRCKSPLTVKSYGGEYVDTSPSINNVNGSGSGSGVSYSYAILVKQVGEIPEGCIIHAMAPTLLEEFGNRSFPEIHHQLTLGFDLVWDSSFSGIYWEYL
ncbi:PREDICTED: uncharacterized protein LOC104610365 [Nelumbo nucifera]|uniref:Uncharacterized protein LOC104610365 n=2 Tax=Nelumbo nucifera TaxID=4432 RepID=A0A1U8QBI9_NELNU|nr:PREDICTED: uncharacterized protein LOC104610365 [Nelumbo nucifera]DAD18131.1 TPA_asm: hypothetical protein HUJ06_019594 [Nelumbo nucifera]